VITYANAHEAIRDANALNRPVGIAYHAHAGWRVYDLTQGCPVEGEPEFLCFGSGYLPLPLSAAGEIIIDQFLGRRSQ
jgi:hypothetical protein